MLPRPGSWGGWGWSGHSSPGLTCHPLSLSQARTTTGGHLKIGRSTLYRALQPDTDQATEAGEATELPPPMAGNDSPPATVSAPARPIPARIRQPDEPLSSRERQLRDRLVRQREAMRASACPTCGNEPVDAQTRWHQRQDLAITWLYPDPASPLRVVERVHCSACQPHQQAATVVCELCGEGPLLVNDLVAAATDDCAAIAVTGHGSRQPLSGRGPTLPGKCDCSAVAGPSHRRG